MGTRQVETCLLPGQPVSVKDDNSFEFKEIMIECIHILSGNSAMGGGGGGPTL